MRVFDNTGFSAGKLYCCHYPIFVYNDKHELIGKIPTDCPFLVVESCRMLLSDAPKFLKDTRHLTRLQVLGAACLGYTWIDDYHRTFSDFSEAK